MVALLLLTIVFSACFGSPQHSVQLGLEAQVRNVVNLKDSAYVDGRKGLEAQYRLDSKPFDQLIKTTSDWKVRLLCQIVVERVKKSNNIAEYLRTEPKLVKLGRGWEERYEVGGRVLAEHGKDIPLFLVERLWRIYDLSDVELVDWEHVRYEQYGTERALARAVGYLKVVEARELLEAELNPSFYVQDFDKKSPKEQKDILSYSHMRLQVIAAIGEIGSALSVPILLNALEAQIDEETPTIFGSLAMALRQCADRSVLPQLREKLVATKSAAMREYLERLIQRLEQGTK